jgi:hypothetical protein
MLRTRESTVSLHAAISGSSHSCAICTAAARAQGARFVEREHQRRQVKAASQAIADSRLTLDRHALRLQLRDIAVDGPFAQLQPLGQPARRH